MNDKTQKLLRELEAMQSGVAPIEITSLTSLVTSNPLADKWKNEARRLRIEGAARAVSKIATDTVAMSQLAATFDLLVYGPTYTKALKVIEALQGENASLLSRLDKEGEKNSKNQKSHSRATNAENEVKRLQAANAALVALLEEDGISLEETLRQRMALAEEDIQNIDSARRVAQKSYNRDLRILKAAKVY